MHKYQLIQRRLQSVIFSDVNKDWTHKDKDKDLTNNELQGLTMDLQITFTHNWSNWTYDVKNNHNRNIQYM